MPQAPDTSAIHRLVGRARRRIRMQWALEGATLAAIPATALALAGVFAIRLDSVTEAHGIAWLCGAAALVVIGAVLAAARRLDDERVARRIDRASGLSDRLSTAIAFARAPAADDPTTEQMMRAAVEDGVAKASRADVRGATPFHAPRDLRAALGFLAASAIIAGVALPVSVPPPPHLYRVIPDHAPPGAPVRIEGDHLPVAPPGAAPAGAEVVLQYTTLSARPRATALLGWDDRAIDVRLPADAPLGDARLVVSVGGTRLGQVPLTVVDPRDARYHKDDAVALDPDEKAYIESIVAELRNVAKREQDPELEDYANKIEALLKQAENGELTKEQLLEALAKAQDALNKGKEPDEAQLAKQLAQLGNELAKDPLTKPLGEALQKNDLAKAQQELEKLAQKLDDKQLSNQQKQDLSKKLDQVAKQMQQQKDQDQQQNAKAQEKLQKEISQLEQQQQHARTDREQHDLEQKLEEKRRELQKLQKDAQQKQDSNQRRALERLQKDMQQAAQNLSRPQPGQDQQARDRQASRSLHDAARESGRVDQDRRKQATQRKMASQMEELREAMQRAKQQRNKGPGDPFNRQGKNQDFLARARGQKSGQSGAWKPGQQGQGQNGQNGQQQGGQPGGDTWGVGHDPNMTGDPTAKSGHEHDQELQGQEGKSGGSTRETILAAAQKGFASVRYQKVYTDYQRIVEEVMRTEKLPSSYRYYVKRYFAKIHPELDAPSGGAPQGQP